MIRRFWCWISTNHNNRECLSSRAHPYYELMTFKCRDCGSVFQEKW